MPPRRAAAASAAASGSKKRPLAAAAAAAATTTTLFEFDSRWAGPVKEMYKDRELHDVVLSAGDVSVAAHRIILAAASPHLRGLFKAEMKDSRAREVELQEVDGRGLQQIVDFAAGRCSRSWTSRTPARSFSGAFFSKNVVLF